MDEFSREVRTEDISMLQGGKIRWNKLAGIMLTGEK
jgi:hypothetical protein